MGYTDENFPIHPHRIILTITVESVLDASIHRHKAGLIMALDLPGCAIGEPVVWPFFLVAIADFLLKETVLIVNAVPVAGHVQGGQGIKETGRQTTKPAVAERGITL